VISDASVTTWATHDILLLPPAAGLPPLSPNLFTQPAAGPPPPPPPALQDLAEHPAAKVLFDKAADILGYDLLQVGQGGTGRRAAGGQQGGGDMGRGWEVQRRRSRGWKTAAVRWVAKPEACSSGNSSAQQARLL
jgi:hypothetical protein